MIWPSSRPVASRSTCAPGTSSPSCTPPFASFEPRARERGVRARARGPAGAARRALRSRAARPGAVEARRQRHQVHGRRGAGRGRAPKRRTAPCASPSSDTGRGIAPDRLLYDLRPRGQRAPVRRATGRASGSRSPRASSRSRGARSRSRATSRRGASSRFRCRRRPPTPRPRSLPDDARRQVTASRKKPMSASQP